MLGNISESAVLIFVGLFFASALYASVGHGGASAYLAVMGLAGMAPAEMKPIALSLNIAVSLLAMIAFVRAGYFRGNLFWPLAAASIPAAFLGGWLQLPDPIFKWILAAALVFGAWRLAFGKPSEDAEIRSPKIMVLIALGFGIGLLSGLIGIGGGIFLTPLFILFHWSNSKTAAAISAAFIFVNSISGLAGFIVKGAEIPIQTFYLLPVVLIGGMIGANWGSRRAQNPALLRALALVLVIAAAKFMIV
ncbi:MAG: sulfite exporter TauE/SafE family protein [Verrucomicrobiota bacterium]